ncbi:MAG: glutathione S-transferase family protein [Pseudomonadota bacterium]
MSALTLYWCPQTRAARAVWMLEELGVHYERVLINIRDEASQSDPDFRAISPMGKVPALRHGSVGITDSTAICMYLADEFSEAGLAPPIVHPDRAAYLQWMIFSGTYIEPGMLEGFGALQPNKVSYGFGDWPSVLDVLERGVTDKTWLVGDKFSAADVMVGMSAHFVRLFGLLKEGDRPAIHAYIERCAARPAFQAAMKLDADHALPPAA